MEEKLNRLQFKISIPEMSVHVPRFLVNWISKKVTVPLKHEALPHQSLCLLNSKKHRIRSQRNPVDRCSNWQPVVPLAIKSWRSEFIIQIIVLLRTSKWT